MKKIKIKSFKYIKFNIHYNYEFIKTLLVYESLVSDEGNFFFMAPGVIPHYLTSEYINHPDVLDLFKFNNFALLMS